MAKRDQISGFLCREDSGDASDGENVSFGNGVLFDQVERGFLEEYLALCDGFSLLDGFGGDVHHRGFASVVQMG